MPHNFERVGKDIDLGKIPTGPPEVAVQLAELIHELELNEEGEK